MLSIVMGVAHDADLRSLSERTLELAKALDLGIRMVHISSTIQSRDESAWAERLVDWVRRRGAEATYQHVIGEPVDQLLRLDVHPETAFMAIGRTLTPSGVNAIGGVGLRLLRRATKPVFVVGPYGVEPMHEVPRILYPVDFSERSMQGFTWARRLAESSGGEIHLAHVVKARKAAWRWPRKNGAGGPEPGVSSSAEALDAARERLDALHLATRAPVVRHVVSASSTAYGISQLVSRLAPSMMIIPSAGQGALENLFIGSVATSVLATALVPTLVVKSGR